VKYGGWKRFEIFFSPSYYVTGAKKGRPSLGRCQMGWSMRLVIRREPTQGWIVFPRDNTRRGKLGHPHFLATLPNLPSFRRRDPHLQQKQPRMRNKILLYRDDVRISW
jgi:hypothetical protein